MEIPKLVKGGGLWHPNVCLGWADDFLSWLQQEICAPHMPPHSYHIAHYYPTHRVVRLTKLSDASVESEEPSAKRPRT